MTDNQNELDTMFHTALEAYPQSPLPPGFQAGVMAHVAARVVAVEQPSVTSLDQSWRPVDQSSTGFLEMSSALVMGVLLCVLLLLGLLVGGRLPELGLPATLPAFALPVLPWTWVVPAILIAAAEMVLVILAGLYLTEN